MTSIKEMKDRGLAFTEPGSIIEVDDVRDVVDWGPEVTTPPATRLLAYHSALCNDAFDLMQVKNHDYTSGGGDPYANFRMASALGVEPLVGMAIRMGDKLQRIRTYAEKGTLQVNGEGFRDSILDIINYAVLMYGLGTEESDDA